MKTPCPACNSKRTGPWRDGLLVCHSCGVRWSQQERDSGRVEGGDHDDRRPDARLIREESGGATGYAIRKPGNLRGGLK